MTWLLCLGCRLGRYDEGLAERMIAPGLVGWVLECRTCGRRRAGR